MADIFISYAREDHAVAAMLAGALERCGWSVWWDRIIPPGKTFDEVIETELTSARCAIVLWSKAAVASRWVRDEAQEAINDHKLVPVLLDGVAPPMGFRRIQAADIAGWRGDNNHSGWQDLKGAVDNLLREPSHREPTAAGTDSVEQPKATILTKFQDLRGAVGNLLREPSHQEPTAAGSESVEQPQATILTKFPLNAKTIRSTVSAVLLGYLVSIVSLILILLVVTDALHVPEALGVRNIVITISFAPVGLLVGLVASVGIVNKLVSKSITAPETWRLCSRHAVIYCLPVVVLFLSCTVWGRRDIQLISFASTAVFGMIAALAWRRMRYR